MSEKKRVLGLGAYVLVVGSMLLAFPEPVVAEEACAYNSWLQCVEELSKSNPCVQPNPIGYCDDTGCEPGTWKIKCGGGEE